MHYLVTMAYLCRRGLLIPFTIVRCLRVNFESVKYYLSNSHSKLLLLSETKFCNDRSPDLNISYNNLFHTFSLKGEVSAYLNINTLVIILKNLKYLNRCSMALNLS